MAKPEPADLSPPPQELTTMAETESETSIDVPIPEPVETTPTPKRPRLRPGPKPRSPEPLWQILTDDPALLSWETEKRRRELRTRYRAKTGHLLGDDKIDDWVREFERKQLKS
jgi:hypothetical protein